MIAYIQKNVKCNCTVSVNTSILLHCVQNLLLCCGQIKLVTGFASNMLFNVGSWREIIQNMLIFPVWLPLPAKLKEYYKYVSEFFNDSDTVKRVVQRFLEWYSLP